MQDMSDFVWPWIFKSFWCRAVVEHLSGDKGWRTALGLAGGPALCLTLAAILLPETPNSLAERGHIDRARRVLESIRGTDDVTAEMDDIIAAAEESNQVSVTMNMARMPFAMLECRSLNLLRRHYP